MGSKAELFATLAVRTGVASLVRRVLRRKLLVVTYHRIRENQPAPDFMFDDQTFSCSADQFDAQVRALTRYRRVVSLDQVLEALRGGRALPDNATLITFDDGARDNYDLALPILRKHRATAVFFIPTLMLEQRCTGWWDTVAYVLKSAPAGHYEVRFAGLSVPVDLTSRERVREGIQSVQRGVKSLKSLDYGDFFAQVAAATGGRMPTAGEQCSQIVTAEQLAEMAACGMEIGGHSHTHRILAQLTEDEQRHELAHSKQILEAALGSRVRSLAYPVGGEGHYTRRTCELAGEVGYECAFNFRLPGGFADLGSPDRFDIPRISAVESGGVQFQAQVSGVDLARIGAWRASLQRAS